MEHDNVYRYLISAPATSEEVRTAMGLRPEAARAALAGLEAVRFVYRLPGDPVRFAAASPGVVDAAIARKLAELRQAQESLGQIASQYRALRLAEYGTGVFEVIRGAEALRERTLDLLTSARTEALNMVKPPVIAVHSEEHVRPGAAVRGRLIFDRDAVGDARTLDALRQSLDPHAEIRVHTNVPVKMLAIDRKLALIPLIQRDAVPLGVMIGESEVLDSILALFDYVWATAVRLHVGNVDSSSPAGKSPLPEADRQLLSLLLAGLTDEAIAAHFRVSVRTIERKVRALMDAAQVRTRMQLGWEAARQRWVLTSQTPVSQQRAGDRDALALAAGQPGPAMADERLQAVRQPLDQAAEPGDPQDLIQLFPGRAGPAQEKVLVQGPRPTGPT